MAADARTDLAPPRALSLAWVRVTPVQVLVAVVAASAIARTFVGWLRATPIYFPDEYIYSEVGRSIAEHGRPLVRGGSAHFPALLQPLLTAPAWLFDDVATSFRTIQLINAVVMSLGAVAVFWLARRLGLSPWVAVALGAFTVAIPDMLYSSWILADPFAFPLVLAAVAAATAALDRPTKRAQFAFVAFAGLATFARVQFVVLPVCFVVALAIVGLRERRFKQALREQKLVLGLLALGLVPVFVAGPRSVLGYYDSVVSLDLSPLPILRWMGADGMLLLYSSGWVLVPGALMGLALALWKPRSRGELGFAVFGSLVALAVVFEAALYAANGADRIQERYFFAILPLIGLLFALYVRRGFPHRVPHALIAGAALALSARVPLAGFSAADGKSNSPLLLAVGIFEQKVGDVGLASLLVAIVVAGLSIVAAATGFFPRIAMPLLVGLAIAGSCVASLGAVTFGHQAADNVYDTILWPDASYVDHADLGDVALLAAPSNDRGFTTEQLFWNRSIDRLLVLPDASSARCVRVRADHDRQRRHNPHRRQAVHGPAPRRLLRRDSGAPGRRAGRANAHLPALEAGGHPAPLALRRQPLLRRLARPDGLHQALAGPGREARRPPRPRPQPAARPHRDRDAPQASGRERQGGRREAGRDRARQHPGLLLGPVVGGLRGPGQHELRRAARHGAHDEADVHARSVSV